MLVFKFGGASVRSADAVRQLVKIVSGYAGKNLVVVVSAMGKTTNALEEVVFQYFRNGETMKAAVDVVKDYHYKIIRDLFPDPAHQVYAKTEKLFTNLETRISEPPSLNYDYDYDQVVCYGELLSTLIVSEYLNEAGVATRLIDIRRYLKSDNTFREGKIDWDLSDELVSREFIFRDEQVLLTQGFLASTKNNLTTTLGREGSDYTAAILANILNAEKVIIWKDVPGVLNADPKWFDDTVLLDRLSYQDAIELAYYGASVIHPKTMQPLKSKNISLQVKSFIDPKGTGTLIGNEETKQVPSFIFKMDQVLLRISPKDFSFIAEKNLELILGIFAGNTLRINLMQNTAVSFQVCVDNDRTRIPAVIRDMEDHFNVEIENSLELITIRYYDAQTIARVLVNKNKILEQRSKTIIQMVVRDLG